jgi:hypothetical protein
MKTKLTAVGIIVAATLMIATTIASMAPSAMAAQRNNLASGNQAGSNTQTGLVNLGNTQVSANVGANVCALSQNC